MSRCALKPRSGSSRGRIKRIKHRDNDRRRYRVRLSARETTLTVCHKSFWYRQTEFTVHVETAPDISRAAGTKQRAGPAPRTRSENWEVPGGRDEGAGRAGRETVKTRGAESSSQPVSSSNHHHRCLTT